MKTISGYQYYLPEFIGALLTSETIDSVSNYDSAVNEIVHALRQSYQYLLNEDSSNASHYAKKAIGSVNRIINLQENKSLQYASSLLLGLTEYQQQQYIHAIITFDKAIALLNKTEEHLWLPVFLYAKGNAIMAIADLSTVADSFLIAYKSYHEALLYINQTDNIHFKFAILFALAEIHKQLLMYNEAINYCQQAIIIVDETIDRSWLVALYILKADILIQMQKYDEAYKIINQAESILLGKGQDELHIELSLVKMRLYNQTATIEDATLQLSILKKMTDQNSTVKTTIAVEIEEGHLNLRKGNTEHGLIQLMNAYDSMINIHDIASVIQVALILSKHYETSKEYQESLNWYKEYQKNISHVQSLQSIAMNLFSALSAENRYAFSKPLLYSLYNESKENQEHELRTLKIEADIIADLVSSAANLESRLVDLSENASTLSQVKKAIHDLVHETRLVHKHRHTVINAFNEKYPLMIMLFEGAFESLSRVEREISIMTRAGLSSVDISLLLNLSERTVENHRYRIRKKLDIPASISLTLYLERAEQELATSNTLQY